MVKVLLLIEDYNELTITESYLKKVGFDIIGISNDKLFSQKLMSFNPDIVVIHGNDHRFSSIAVGQRLKENHKYHGRIVMVLPEGRELTPDELLKIKVNSVIQSPVTPEKMIAALAKLAKMNAQILMDKLHRFKAVESKNVKVVGSKDEGPSASVLISDKKRIAKYNQLIQGMKIDSSSTTLTRAETKKRQEEMKKDWNFEELEEMDELKKQFAKALFKKQA